MSLLDMYESYMYRVFQLFVLILIITLDYCS